MTTSVGNMCCESPHMAQRSDLRVCRCGRDLHLLPSQRPGTTAVSVRCPAAPGGAAPSRCASSASAPRRPSSGGRADNSGEAAGGRLPEPERGQSGTP
jgi:hypothetical protein